MPLASGKVSDLSFYKPKKEATPHPEPIMIEYKHKIGEVRLQMPADHCSAALNCDESLHPVHKRSQGADFSL